MEQINDSLPTFNSTEQPFADNKLYIKHDDIFLTHEDILIIFKGNVFSIERLSRDNNGFYIKSNDFSKVNAEVCPNGHKRECVFCNGCKAICRYRCLCGWQNHSVVDMISFFAL